MIESEIESKLRERIQAAGGMCLKWESPGYSGVPDRMILMPGGYICFADLKAPGKKERPRQLYVQRQLRQLGFDVFSAVDSLSKVDEVARRCREMATQAR